MKPFDDSLDRHEVVLTGEGALLRSPTLSLASSAPTPTAFERKLG